MQLSRFQLAEQDYCGPVIRMSRKRTNFDGILVVDLEATCWDSPQPPAGEQSEVIEIGVAIMRPTGITKNESIYVRPTMSAISPFCTELTGITWDTVKTGMPFSSACNRLVEKYGSRNRVWASWGNYDRRMMKDQCELMGIEYPFGHSHINVKDLFSLRYKFKESYSVEVALNTIGLKFVGSPHSGKDDAYNIARLLSMTLYGNTQ